MEDDKVKQNSGAQQGNIHQDSDEGRNDGGKPGSTLGKTSDRHSSVAANDDGEKTNDAETPSHGGKQEPNTEGIP